MTLYTGLGGIREFEISFLIAACKNNPKMLEDQFRKIKQENYRLKEEIAILKTPWYKKLYNYIKTINK